MMASAIPFYARGAGAMGCFIAGTTFAGFLASIVILRWLRRRGFPLRPGILGSALGCVLAWIIVFNVEWVTDGPIVFFLTLVIPPPLVGLTTSAMVARLGGPRSFSRRFRASPSFREIEASSWRMVR